MRRITIYIVLLCFLIPTGLLLYKHLALGLTLLPHKVDDVWLFHVSLRSKDPAASTVSFPVPRAGDGLRITDERHKKKGIDTLVDRSNDSAMMTWISNGPIPERVSYSARIDIHAIKIKNIPKDSTVTYPKAVQKYLKLPTLTPEEESALKTLEAAIFEGNTDKTTTARKAFYYVDEEIQRSVKSRTIMDALTNGTGSALVKAKLYSYLLRRKQIPARVVAMWRLPILTDKPEYKGEITFANEVFLNNRWIPVDTNRSHFGERPDRYLVLHRHFETIEKTMSRKNIAYTITTERAVMNKFNKEEYRKELASKGSWLSAVSLYRLPLPVQNIFATILLIPIGTLVLCLARNMLGVPTFGMFTPILLTLFFTETSLSFGLMFFMAVVLLGLLERNLLDKLFLLAVPRLSIILTLVIVLLIVISFTGLAEVLGATHIGYFPIVIVTSFIERFSIMLTEDGLVNTLKTLAGTLVISILTFGLYSIDTLEIMFFTNPEMLLYVIGLLVLIGKYKGYRVSEFIRFKDLVRQVKARQAKAELK